MDLALNGKRAIVAGASSGLGLGCAQALAAEGAKVVIGSRSQDRLDTAAKSINELGPAHAAQTVAGDVSSIAGATAFVEQAIELLDGVDILITNAGGPPPGNFETTPIEDYQVALDLNLLSTVAMVSAATPAMKAQAWGRVVAITSLSVRMPMAQLILSNVARSGATAFLKTTATELAPHGITVNSLQPGLHLTGRLRDLYDDPSTLAAGVPTTTLGDPDNFGQIAAFLCSDSAKFVTGAAIPVDGGACSGLQ